MFPLGLLSILVVVRTIAFVVDWTGLSANCACVPLIFKHKKSATSTQFIYCRPDGYFENRRTVLVRGRVLILIDSGIISDQIGLTFSSCYHAGFVVMHWITVISYIHSRFLLFTQKKIRHYVGTLCMSCIYSL